MPLTVYAAGSAVLATLPAQFRATGAPDADVLVVSGLRPGWTDAARAGARGVMITRPGPGDPDAVRALTASGAVVAVETPVVDPAWTAALPCLRVSVANATLLDSVAIEGSEEELYAALVGQLALVHSLTGGLDAVRGGRRDPSCYWISAGAGGLAVNLAGTLGSAPALRVDLIGAREHWKAAFDTSTTAGPTRIARYDATGGELWPATYESGARVAWRQLAAALTGGPPPAYGPAELARDLELATQLGT